MSPFVAPHSITALVAYALWTIALVMAVAACRTAMVLSGKTRLNGFTSGVPHGGDGYWRLNRAHLNTAENLPVFAAIVLAGWVVGMETATFNRLAVIVVAARVVQSLVHIASGSVAAVSLRFTALAVQLVCEIWMALLVLHAGSVF